MRCRAISYIRRFMNIGAICILGVDPGLRKTGWGVIEAAGSRLIFIACGSIETDAATSLAERLAAIHRLLTGLVEREGPHEAAIEETFINRDPQSALKLGQARGVALATLALTGLPVAEYAANLIKKTVVGVGHAEKRQVAMMVRMLLPASTALDFGRGRRARRRHLPRPASRGARARRGMIGKLKGVVDSVDEETIILDVNGVGYLVSASARTLRAIPAVGELTEMLIETYVREDAIRLFGFLTAAERDWFRLLQSVQGVGAKVALGILGALSAEALSTAVARQDKAMMARAPGVGPKLAARLVLELKDKAPALGVADFAHSEAGLERAPKLAKAAEDAVLALVGLGYAQAQAAAAVSRISAQLGPAAETAALIRAGLKELAQ